MAYLNANIPVTYAQIRREYLYDLTGHHGEVEDCIIFGLASITGRPILFHAIMENGAVFYRLPISAFIQRGYNIQEVPRPRLDELDISVESDKQAKQITEIMESAVDLEIPNKVDYESGKNWGDIH